jgi:hypothetical protein
MKLGSWLLEKLNPAQRYIAMEQPEASSREPERSYIFYFENLEIVNRAVNMVVDDAAEINYSITTEKVECQETQNDFSITTTKTAFLSSTRFPTTNPDE